MTIAKKISLICFGFYLAVVGTLQAQVRRPQTTPNVGNLKVPPSSPRPPVQRPAGPSKQIQVSSETAERTLRSGKSILLMKGNCHFTQGNATMTSDSAYFYSEENRLDAFSRVIIHQADTITITGDKLYYNGNTHKAQLFDHCVMTDRQGVLRTNHLDYDLVTKIGTYYDGGKITNKDNILVSRTGYYYENTKVAYFKTDVTILTPTTTIKSDTLQYNNLTGVAYFFGPTRIKSKDDFIYCENGEYNTANNQASFRKHAYYTSGTKRLQGDSLYYDKRAGFAKALNNVTFTDSLDNEILKGGFARYDKTSEETIITRKPLLIFLTASDETVDSSISTRRADSSKISGNGAKRLEAAKVDTAKVFNQLSKSAGAPAVSRKNPTYQQILAGNAPQDPNDSAGSVSHSTIPNLSLRSRKLALKPVKIRERLDSIFLTADSFRTVIASGPAAHPRIASKKVVRKKIAPVSADTLEKKAGQLLDKIRQDVHLDSMKQARTNTTPAVKSAKKDTIVSKKKVVIVATPKDSIPAKTPAKRRGFLSRIFGNSAPPQIKPPDSNSASAKRIKQKRDSVARRRADQEAIASIPDLLEAVPWELKKGYHQLMPGDTAKFRVVYAFHHAKLFKQDFQAAADSMVYTYVDSTIRCFIKPALWTQGTQMTSDTISVKIKNRKLDSLIMIRSSFIISKVDSLKDQDKFNQISGRDIYGKFVNNRLDRMRVEGNGKSLFYASEQKTDSVTKVKSANLTGMNSETCSYFLMYFVGNKAKRITAIDDPQGHFYPISKLPAGKEKLPGFLWRDSERPRSRADLFKKPTKKQIKYDAEINKKTAADTLAEESLNILDVPKPKLKQSSKKKAGLSDSTSGRGSSDSSVIGRPSRSSLEVRPSDSTLSGNGFLITIPRRALPTKKQPQPTRSN